jgi:hypothetical protein
MGKQINNINIFRFPLAAIVQGKVLSYFHYVQSSHIVSRPGLDNSGILRIRLNHAIYPISDFRAPYRRLLDKPILNNR